MVGGGPRRAPSSAPSPAINAERCELRRLQCRVRRPIGWALPAPLIADLANQSLGLVSWAIAIALMAAGLQSLFGPLIVQDRRRRPPPRARRRPRFHRPDRSPCRSSAPPNAWPLATGLGEARPETPCSPWRSTLSWCSARRNRVGSPPPIFAAISLLTLAYRRADLAPPRGGGHGSHFDVGPKRETQSKGERRAAVDRINPDPGCSSADDGGQPRL